MTTQHPIDRPPRIQPELPAGEVPIPRPPEPERTTPERFAQIGLPLLTLIGYVLVATISGGQQMLLVPMGLAVLASVGFSLYTLRHERLERRAEEQAYAERLRELRTEWQTSQDLQRRFYHYTYPRPAATLQLALEARRLAESPRPALRSPARLYERRVGDDDFATIRLGIGARASTVSYLLDQGETRTTPLVRAAQKLAADSRFVSDVPITLALRPVPAREDDPPRSEQQEHARAPQAHAVGIAGTRDEVYAFARALLGHYAAFHAPGDARLCVLAEQRGPWAWAESLPHCAADEQLPTLCFTAELPALAEDSLDDEGGELEQYLERLRRLLAQRKIRAQDNEEGESASTVTTPFVLVVIDLLDLPDTPTSPLHAVVTDAAVAILVEEGAQLGAAVIFLVPERSKIPGGCGAIIEVETTAVETGAGAKPQRSFRYAATGLNSSPYLGRADGLSADDAARLATTLGALTLRQGQGANLSTTVPFLDLVGCADMSALRERASTRWRASMDARRANWLRARLGLMAGNKPRTLVFSARRDGVHGIVAGSTGAGKSELLIALIASLSLNYDPSALNFVLVDYKGGGAFREFAALPHCVDIITNLAADGVTRMFTAIGAEMRRRQALNAATGTKDIVEYRRKGLHLNHAPYPFLFIIVDEFAEMIAERPEYKAELESITRVGRAQGVSLLLAAQRPSGVTDQMRSNIKYRICLRVETPGESRELLRRGDAAFLPAGLPGRGYLQVGNEAIELIQVAYAGGTYRDPRRPAPPPVVWPERGGDDLLQAPAPVELYKAVIDTLGALAHDEARPAQKAPWPAALPTRLALTEPLLSSEPSVRTITSRDYLQQIAAITLGQAEPPTLTLSPALTSWLGGQAAWQRPQHWPVALRPVVGLIDDPAGARQLPLVIDIPRGNVLVVGASGAGKTTLVRSTLLSLAASHHPGSAHFYLLDMGGRGLSVLAGLPHTGAYIAADEEGFAERAEQVLREIDTIVERRRQLLSEAGIDDILQYNRAHPEAAEPAIVLALDNLRAFIEAFGEPRDDVETALDRLVAVLRQGRPYGVAIIATTPQADDLSGPLLALFEERLALRLSESVDYRTLLGAGVPAVSEIAGRGYTLVGRTPLAFQAALPFEPTGEADPAAENREIVQLCAQMRREAEANAAYPRPVRVEALPRSVLMRRILADAERIEPGAGFLVGLEAASRVRWAASMDPAQADWLQVPIGLVSGGRARTLRLEAKHDGVHGMVAGGTGSGKSELLMSLIVGLALRYDPRALQFVLVDYKGGGAFTPFAELPHCVESVTNLNRAAVRRMFTAIGAEMRRRQRLNAETGTKDIVEYRQKGLHLSHAPYPFLFIIIDEYAEMIAESPEFGADLDSITRVGRAQGVSLLLAAQRPVGVSDQMRANIKLRICLRVEQADTSRELLRRADAAYLPSGLPGRGYIQVGNEPIELVQVAFSGDRDPYAAAREDDGEQPRFFELAVRMAQQLHTGERPRAPWPPALPPSLSLDTPLRAEYLDTSATPLPETEGDALALNGATRTWLAGAGSWTGVDWERSALRAILGLNDDPAGARQLPLVLDLSRGHGVVFGASGWGKTTLLRTLALSLAATHRPDELHLHALDLGGRGLEALRELPHTGTLISPDERGYEERIQQLWRELNELLDRRKRLLSTAGAASMAEYNAAQPEQAEPALLLLVDNIGELIETFGGDDRDKEANLLEQFVSLARQGRTYGLHIVVTAPRLSTLSSKLFSLFTERLSLRLAEADDYSAIVGARVPESDELPGRGYARVGRDALIFQVALPPDALDREGRVRGELRQIRAIAARMQEAARTATLRSRPLRIDALPKSVLLQELLAGEAALSREPGRFVADLVAATRALWERTASPEHADWLQVPLGVLSGGRTRTLRLEAKHDGVHGMVAGGTGSGKSELLMSLIVGLALRYAPETLTFVLVDYKGGGAFAPFAQLPHCVDIVTNLNPAAVARMFTAIGAEIARRQALNATTGTKDIVEYRRKGLHLSHAPYPFLFIIIDEYAEMIDANEEFRYALDSITRVGRAQGINLLLASQQPKGVSDQMRANIKLRLCLRVEQTETSRELLRRPDAALLPNGLPGRGYLQVGNEPIELVQVAYAGDSQVDDRPVPALWPDRPHQQENAVEEPPRFFDTAVAIARELAGATPVPRPWPTFLPNWLSLESAPLTDQNPQMSTPLSEVSAWLGSDVAGLWPGVSWGEGALRAIVGLVDLPAEARQEPLTLDLTRGHLAIFGDSGSGKTSLLRTLLISLAATHSPDELHVYALDLGGRGLKSLDGLPHIGSVVYGDEERFEERLGRLLDVLSREVARRQQLLSDAGATSLAEFNRHAAQAALPAVLVLIDNIAELLEGYEALVEGSLIPLVRRGLGVGVSFVVTSTIPTVLPSRLASLFGERLTFRQSNPDIYTDIVGRGAVEIGDTPGRGYVRREGRPLMVQAALPLGLPGEGMRASEAEELRLLARTMVQVAAMRGREAVPPDPIAILGERVLLAELLASVGPVPERGSELVLGLGENLQPVRLDPRNSGLHGLVVGPPRAGKTTVLTSIALGLAERYTPEQVSLILIDLQRGFVNYGGAESLANLPHVLAAISDIEQLEELITHLESECRALEAAGGSRALYVLIDNLDELSEELDERQELSKRLLALLRRHGRDGLHVLATSGVDATASDLKRRILAGGLGLALSSAAALGVLTMQRTPAALRGGELPPGRGFLVRAGTLTQVQVATPYEPADEDGRAAAIDAWVAAARERAGDQEARWSQQASQPATTTNGALHLSKSADRQLALLRRGMRWELEQPREDEQELLVAQFAGLEPTQWSDPAALLPLLRELWLRRLSRQGLDPDMAREAIAGLDDESLLIALEGELHP
jgi:DNA segregation ATPase FtsK/SpoIIIE-like protein